MRNLEKRRERGENDIMRGGVTNFHVRTRAFITISHRTTMHAVEGPASGVVQMVVVARLPLKIVCGGDAPPSR